MCAMTAKPADMFVATCLNTAPVHLGATPRCAEGAADSVYYHVVCRVYLDLTKDMYMLNVLKKTEDS